MLKIIQPIVKKETYRNAGNQYCLRLLILIMVGITFSGQKVYTQEIPSSNDNQAITNKNEEAGISKLNRYRVHSPQKATLLSATLPGMGQIYNGKIWKVPIIYAGFGTIAYFIRSNNTHYQEFKQAYMAIIDGNPNTVPEERFEFFRTETIKSGMDFYRRNLEISFIAAAALYVLNILDATVDAHLLDFDVGENLALRFRPSLTPAGQGNMTLQTPTTGFTLTLRF